jgi:hypothetical protein
MGQIRRRGNCDQIRWYRNGQRHEETVHGARKQDAVDLLKIREGDVAKGLPVTPKSVRFKFDDAAKDLKSEYTVNNRRSVDELERRIDKHLTSYFTGRKMSSITAVDIRAYTAHRKQQGIQNAKGERIRDVSNAEINRELATLKRMFTLALQAEKISRSPYIPMLEERNTRKGFFELEQLAAVLRRLPTALRLHHRIAHSV